MFCLHSLSLKQCRCSKLGLSIIFCIKEINTRALKYYCQVSGNCFIICLTRSRGSELPHWAAQKASNTTPNSIWQQPSFRNHVESSANTRRRLRTTIPLICLLHTSSSSPALHHSHFTPLYTALDFFLTAVLPTVYIF